MSAGMELQARQAANTGGESAQWRSFSAGWLPIENVPGRDIVGWTAPIDPVCWEALLRFAPAPFQRFQVLGAALQVLLIRYSGIFHTDALRLRFVDFLGEQVTVPGVLHPIHERSGLQVTIAAANTFEQVPDHACDLTFVYREDGTQCGWRYFDSQWPPGRISLLNEHFWKLLGMLLENPQASIGQHDYLSTKERVFLTQEWPGEADYSQAMASVPESFEEIVRRYPDETALVEGRWKQSYAALNQSANQLAHYLMYFSVRPASVVALWMEPGLDLIRAMTAAVKLGAVATVIDHDLPLEQVQVELAGLGQPLLITRAERATEARRAGWPLLDIDREKQAIRSQSKLNPGTQVLPEHAVFLVKSSQREQSSNSLLLLHRNVVFGATRSGIFPVALQRRQAFTAAASTAQGILEIWGALLNGGSVHFAPQTALNSPKRLAHWLRREGISSWIIPASRLATQYAEMEQAIWNVPQLVITEGPLYGQSRERLLHNRPPGTTWELIGSAEVVLIGILRKLRPAELPDSGPCIGRPPQGSAVHLIDAAGLPVPVGVPGELCLEGPQLAWGYLDDQTRNQARFPAKGGGVEQGGRLFRSGHLACWDAQGRLVDFGPKQSMVRFEGNILHLHAVEARLREHAAVTGSAVVLREVAGGLRKVIAYVVLNAPVPNVRRVMRESLAGRVPEALLPQEVITLDQLPLTADGTVDRAELAKPVLGPRISGAEADARAAEQLAMAGGTAPVLRQGFSQAKTLTASLRNLLRRLV